MRHCFELYIILVFIYIEWCKNLFSLSMTIIFHGSIDVKCKRIAYAIYEEFISQSIYINAFIFKVSFLLSVMEQCL